MFSNFISPDDSRDNQSTFSQVYASTSYDPVTDTYDRKTIAEIRTEVNNRFGTLFSNREIQTQLEQYREDFWTHLATFFGLPYPVEFEVLKIGQNSILKYKPLTIGKLLSNLAGLEDDKTVGITWLNRILSPLTFLKNVVVAICSTIQNTAKLFTEYAPAMIANHARKEAERAWNEVKRGNFFSLFGLAIYGSIFLAARGVQLIGRTVTSPFQSVRAGWFTGNEYGERFARLIGIRNEKALTAARWIGGVLMAGLSSVVTAAIYTALVFPILIGAAPAMGVHLSPLMSQFGSLFTNTAIGDLLTTLGFYMGAALMKIGITSFIASNLTPIAIGAITFLTPFASLVYTTVGTIISELVEAAKVWLRYNNNHTISFIGNDTASIQKEFFSDTENTQKNDIIEKIHSENKNDYVRKDPDNDSTCCGCIPFYGSKSSHLSYTPIQSSSGSKSKSDNNNNVYTGPRMSLTSSSSSD